MHRLALPLVLLPGLLPLALAGCSQGYSPNTYASDAAQSEASVQRGIIIGVRQIMITAAGAVGAAAGGAAGGAAGAQVAGAGGPVVTALGAIGGTLVGGLGGAAAAQAVEKTKGWEYIVQEEPGDKLVSVTQTSKTPLGIGLHVLVIAGTQQARIVPDYTVQIAAAPPPPPPPAGSTDVEIRISPDLPPPAVAPAPPAAPVTTASGPPATPAPPASDDPVAPPNAPPPTPGPPAAPPPTGSSLAAVP